MPTKTTNGRLNKFATGESPWGPQANANADTTDAWVTVTGLLVTPLADLPATSLGIRVAPGKFIDSAGATIASSNR